MFQKIRFVLAAALFTLACVSADDKPTTTVQEGFITPIVPLPGTDAIPPTDGCNRGENRVGLVGVSFQTPSLRYRASPDTRPTPALSSTANAPWTPELVRAPISYYWEYRDLEITTWGTSVAQLWPLLEVYENTSLHNFRYPTGGWGWLTEEHPLWMRWKPGRDSFTTDRFSSALRTLYGAHQFSWGTASAQRGGYRPPFTGIWSERWLLLCGQVEQPEWVLPYLNMHLTKYLKGRWVEGLTPSVTIRRHPADARCPRVTYSCQEQLVPLVMDPWAN